MSSIGLDLGSTEFRSIRITNGRFVGRKIPAFYCVLDDKSSNRRLLEQAQIPYATAKEALIVIGEAALELSTLIHCPVIPVMLEGRLPWNDPVGRQVCVIMIEALVPGAEQTGSHCAISRSPLMEKEKGDSSNFLNKILELRGYEVDALDSGTAVILAELQHYDFSGLAIVVGAESVSVSLSHFGKPIFKQAYKQGFRSIEQRFSLNRHRYLWDSQGNQYLDMQSIKNWLQSSDVSLTKPKTGDELWIAEQCENLVRSALDSMLTDLIKASKQGQFRNRLPVVISGGAAKLQGFDSIVENVLGKSGVPIRTHEAFKSSLDPYSVAKGLLVNSSLQEQSNFSNTQRVA
jgi:hypothetical protein